MSKAARKAALQYALKRDDTDSHSVQWDKGHILVKVVIQLRDHFGNLVPASAVLAFVPDLVTTARHPHIARTVRARDSAVVTDSGSAKKCHCYSTSREGFFSPMATYRLATAVL